MWNIEAVYYIVKANSLLFFSDGVGKQGLQQVLIVKKRNNYNRLALRLGSFLTWPAANYFKENGQLKIS